MIAAEEQVECLIKELANRDPPTNERLGQQWRTSEMARIEARQTFEKARTSTGDLRALGKDLALYINRIGEQYCLELSPGTEVFDLYQTLNHRIMQLLKPAEEEQKLSPNLQAATEMYRIRNQKISRQNSQPAHSRNGLNEMEKPTDRPEDLTSSNESEEQNPQTLTTNEESGVDNSKALVKYHAPDPDPTLALVIASNSQLMIDPKREYDLPLIDTYREEARAESPVLQPHQKLIEDREGLESDEEWDVDDWADIVC